VKIRISGGGGGGGGVGGGGRLNFCTNHHSIVAGI